MSRSPQVLYHTHSDSGDEMDDVEVNSGTVDGQVNGQISGQTNGQIANDAPLDPKEIGMTIGYKQLYSGEEDKRGRFTWQTEVPKDLGKPAEDAESAKWAIIVRRVRVYNDPKKVLALHSIAIQSPYIKDILKDVLSGYPGVTASLKRLEFSGRSVPPILAISILMPVLYAKHRADASHFFTAGLLCGILLSIWRSSGMRATKKQETALAMPNCSIVYFRRSSPRWRRPWPI